MKIKNRLTALITAALFAGSLAACVSDKQSEAELKAQARVSEADARQTALARVPNGAIKESELEKEHGKIIWSFDVATPGTRDITEVNVDAITGAIVSVEHETAEQQAKEKDEDEKKGK